MKKIIMVLIGLGLCAQARSESLSTTDGATYNNITSKRVDPDGLYIEYTPAGGGLGMSKVKFSRLSPDQQKQFGYDANKAKEFEASVAKAMEDFRQDCARREQAAQAQKIADQNREDQQAQVVNDRISAMAQLRQAEAELARAMGGENGGYGGYGGGYGGYGGGYGGPGLFGWPAIGNSFGNGFNDFGFSDFGFGNGFGDLSFGFLGNGSSNNGSSNTGLDFARERFFLLGQGIHRPGFYPINNPSIPITQRGANELGLGSRRP